ncbi:MAG: nickel pincer cofactor biosynthesis protein LarC [Nitrosopumilus sp. H8]|nr:MAG: nickel pincer cofactor biosynthesis protein LarC [Nitrosopumilus sp. H8]
MVLVIDPQVAGVSGDMFLCSLVGLGADRTKITDGIRRCEKFLSGSKITRLDFGRVQRSGLDAFQLMLEADEDTSSRKGTDMKKAVRDSAAELSLSKRAQEFAASCIEILVSSESRVHGVPEDSVHFHEAAGIDTLADIIGAAIALDDLGLFGERIVCLPVSVGGGTVSFSHGTMSNPAGAILEIFRGTNIMIRGSGAGEELATPTGACILVGLKAEPAEYYPSMRVESIGYGAGQKETESPNVLKMVRGTDSIGTDSVKILETNVDDVSGEILGNLIEKVMAVGARDVSIFHGITKKGRPTNLVSVMCDDDTVEDIVDTLVLETGTLGVRISESARFVVPRTEHRATIRLGDRAFEVSYKRSEFKGRRDFKIEFDDIVRVSEETGMPVKETESLLRREIENGQA